MAEPTSPPSSPIQVVLNASSFIAEWQREGGGPSTDFFAGRDGEFIAHKKAVLNQLLASRDALQAANQPGTGFLKVSVRSTALAKSHKPIRSLFRPDRAEIVGGGAQGELVVRVTDASLALIAETVAASEESTTYKTLASKTPDKPGKVIPNPSRARSEIGAVSQLALWDASDRRTFSVDTALDWLSDPRTGGFYLVELFMAPPPQGDWDLYEVERRRMFNELRNTLSSLGPGVRAARLPFFGSDQPMFAVWLVDLAEPAQFFFDPVRSLGQVAPDVAVDLNRERHQALLQRLDRLTLVKRIHLPPVVERHQAASAPADNDLTWKLEHRDPKSSYPRVAVVDGGISDCLGDWIVDKWDLVASADESLEHGTFIAGLLVAGRSNNVTGVIEDPDGCDLVDVKLLPSESDPTSFERYYGTSGALGFFQELNDAVGTLRQRAGVRIFNLSANFQTMADPARYNPLTALLDHIAESHDAIFVISAGNAEGACCRQEWPLDPLAAMATLAAATQDRICSPAESVRNVSVGALNPPHLSHVIGHAPAAYSRRGPGSAAGLKPDLAHVGGSASPAGADHGLWSVHPTGVLCSGAGTSYAAPIVAKTLAALAHGIEGNASRETLTGLLLHHARLPTPLTNPAFGRVARHLVGFGLPPSASEILQGADSQITMVFSARLMKGRRLEFSFSWPACLSRQNGRCRGFAQMTLVSTPPLDLRAEAELVRVDLQAHLNQNCPNGAHASSGWLPSRPSREHKRELRLIAETMKWSPVKIYQWKSSRGQGTSTDWTLKVDHLARDENSIPDEGVPFTLLLTIGDLRGEEPVFREMRQSLQTQGLQLEQIQTATRVSPRV